MNRLKKLIIQSFELKQQERWLKLINKEFYKYRKYTAKVTQCKDKAEFHLHLAKSLNEEYSKRFNKEREG